MATEKTYTFKNDFNFVQGDLSTYISVFGVRNIGMLSKYAYATNTNRQIFLTDYTSIRN